jgi:hypothetical protein
MTISPAQPSMEANFFMDLRDPILEQQVRDQLPPEWRDRCRIIVLEEKG